MATPAQERKALLHEAFGSQADTLEKFLDGTRKVAYDAYKYKLEKQLPLYKERQTATGKVPNFWPKALSNCSALQPHIDPIDLDLLSNLVDVWVNYGEKDVREVEIIFKFKENKYLKETTLSKKLTPKIPEIFAKENGFDQPDQHDLEATLFSESVEIPWKSDEVNLVKQKPAVHPEELEEYDEFTSRGSFFNFFTSSGVDAEEIAEQLLQWWEKAVEYSAGLQVDFMMSEDEEDDEDDEDEEDEDEEEEEDGKAEIDLEEEEQRPKKKAKKA